MDPEKCRELIDGSRILHVEVGGRKGPAKEERVTMDFALQRWLPSRQFEQENCLRKKYLGETSRYGRDFSGTL